MRRGRRAGVNMGGTGSVPTLPALTPSGGHNTHDITRFTLHQLLVTTEILVPPTPRFVGRSEDWRLAGSSHLRAVSAIPPGVITLVESGDGGQEGCDGGQANGDGGQASALAALPPPVADFRCRMRPLTQPKKYGAVPAPMGDGSNPWDYSQLLHRRRARIHHTKHFHWRRRAEFAGLVMGSCRSLRTTHRPRPPDLVTTLTSRLPSRLTAKYDRILKDLFQELREREVQPVLMKPLGTYERYEVTGVERVPWVGRERRALSRAMASFPPAVRTVMAHALRPLDALSLVDIQDGGGVVGVGEGVELNVLITRWRAAARAGRTQLRNTWFPTSLSAIREAALATNLSPSRRHTVMHAFNNLLASKLQEVLIRSVENVLRWLASEEEPWVGPRIKLYLVLDDNQVVLSPDEEALYSAFTDLFKELDDCVQLYRGTWDEPQPPKVPKWRVRVAESGPSDDIEEVVPPLRPLQPRRETLVVTLSDPQWEGFRSMLTSSIQCRFTKAAEFLDQISSEWSSVLNGNVRSEIDHFLSQDAELDEYAGQVRHYSAYVEQASHVPTSATLHVFRLEYKFLRQSLLLVSSSFVSMLRDKLIADHRETTQGLNQQFETIHKHIQEVPKSTDELFKLMEYVEEVRRITIHRLAEEVAAMVVRLKVILDVVHLTPDDLATTASVIVWPSKLKPVIDRAVESLEDLKQEFEEMLVERSGEVNHTLERIQQFVTELEELSDVCHVNKYIREVRKLEGRLEKVSTLVTWVNQEESLFKFQLSSFPLLAELKDCLVPYDELFTLVMKWRKYEKYWMDGDFTSLDPDFIDGETEELARELFRLRKTFKMKFKQQALEGDPRKARMNLDDPNPDNLPGPLRVCALALTQIKNFKEHLPLVSVLCNKGLRPRHWQNLNKAAGFDITPNAGTSLRKVVQMQLGGLLKEFEVVSSGASREYSLELSLANMQRAWQTAKLRKVPQPEADVEVLAGLQEVRELVEDHLITTHTIKNSPFVGPFQDEVKEWESTLRIVQETITLWLKVQTLWMELTPVFSTPDLPVQLPDEFKLFKELDRKWVAVMEETVSAKQLLDVVGDVRALEEVSLSLSNFAIIQKAVYTYLDNKRRIFPRLFFLSNEELISLLCEKDVMHLENHTRKCFDGVHSLHLDDNCDIYAVSSKEGEVVSLIKKLPTANAHQSIENWLLQFQESLIYTLKMKTCAGVDTWSRQSGSSNKDIDSLLLSWPLQVTLIVRHIFWTAEVHQAICGGTQALQECLKRVESEVRTLISMLRKSDLDSSRQSVSTPHSPETPGTPSTPASSRVSTTSAIPPNPSRHSLSTLIVVTVYARDILIDLLSRAVCDEESFAWLAQLRCYLNEDEIEARMLYCSLPWGWEYIGAEGRLVVTPLTCRAQHALVTAYQAHLGGAPEGPAGTGKTETVKDLARSLAMNCLVFNCSDDLDFIAMGKFFTGVAASGSWACFDEFNRLEVGVLSVAAQQILTLISARREFKDTFSMEGGHPLALNPKGFIAVTMNPQYRGRVALPDNLKLLLRPVSMMMADYHSIAEVSLMSCGFLHARALASRVVSVMNHARQMLHPHHHYDFGMRAVKTVLMVTGRLRISFPEWSETEVVLRALREVNHPKLVAEDFHRFEDILVDFFLELPPTPKPPADSLTNCIEKACADNGLLITNEFVLKILQLNETLKERHGVMLVGPPCAAKTTIIKILSSALSLMESDRPIMINTLNPKTLAQGQLLGSLSPLSREWFDGLMSQIIRHGRLQRCWLLLDGPADASWVENLNTALDDSRKLCLPSGETLPVPNDMAIIFEVLDLSQASPASVSRCGMVFVGDGTVNWTALLHTWLHVHAHDTWWEEYSPLLKDLANWLIPPSLAFLLEHCYFLLPITELSLIRSVFPLTATLIQDVLQDSSISMKDSAKVGPIWTTAAFLFSLIWSLAGGLSSETKDVFSNFFRKLAMGYNADHPAPSSIGQIGCPYPAEGSVFDVMFDAKQRSYWRPWTDVVKHAEITETSQISTILVPTIESVRLDYLLDICGRATKGVLVVGGGQSGRRVTTLRYLQGLNTSTVDTTILPITPASTALSLKAIVISHLTMRESGKWGAKNGRRLLAFVDDLHLAAQDSYQALPVHEAIREAMQQKTWISTENTTRMVLEDITWIGGISLDKGGKPVDSDEPVRTDLLEPRCLAGFIVIAAHTLSTETINRVFTTQLNVFLRAGGFVPDVFTVVAGIVSGTLDVLHHAQVSLPPSPTRSHYVYNLSTAARVIHSVSFLRKEAMETKRHFVRLWVHEMYREFCDRLMEAWEVTPIYKIIVNTIKTNFRDKIHVIFDKICNDDGSVTESCLERACWGLMGSIDTPAEERRYEELTDAAQLHQTIAAFINEYNMENRAPLNLVTFKYVVNHITRICRVLGRAGGHLMLVGMGGSGRRSLARLATHICGHKLAYPQITAQDGYAELQKVLKKALIRAGVDEKATVVVVGDSVLHHPTVLHMLNTLILTGDVPNLLPPEDYSYLMERLRLSTEDRKVSEADLWKEQMQRVADLVHIVVMCPPSAVLRHILTHYTAFATRVTMDYFKPWPQEALVKVGEHYLAEVPLRRSIRDAVISAATAAHQMARQVSDQIIAEGKWCLPVTPALYLHLLQEFRGMFTNRQAHTASLKKKYLSGLDKLAFAASQISVMQEMLASLGPQIEEASQDVSKMMELIEQESMEVEARRKLVAIEESEAGVHAAHARTLQEECQAELNRALPALQEAVEALNTLKPADITVVKSMKNPPHAIKLVMAAVCVMLEIKPEKMKTSSVKVTYDFWGPSKRLLGDLSFLQQLRDYDKDNIPDSVMDKINKEYVRLPEFDPVSVAKASSAAEGLCKWVRAMASYNAIAKIVAPKRERLAEAEAEVAALMSLVEAKRGQLRELEEKLEVLQRRFSLSCREKENLEAEQKLCALKLERARKLISGLGGEQSRWEAAAGAAAADLLRLPGDTLLAAASLAYLPPHQPDIRNQLLAKWCMAVKKADLEVTDSFSLVDSLTPPLHIRAWGLEGLPTDSFSLQNATIIKHTVKWPLLVDPDDQGTRWIQQHEAANDLEVVQEQDFDKIITQSISGARVTVLEDALTRCIPKGRPLLLLDLSGEPPPILINIVTRTTTEEGGVRVVSAGALTLQYNNIFRLYLATRQPRPQLSLESAAALTVVNFTVTVHGLHDNLRQILVKKERPELEDERQKLVLTTSSYQRALQGTEERILHTLSSVQGNILESEEAIMILQDTKQMSDEIKHKQEQCVETEAALLLCCQQYETVSKPAAALYMTLASLGALSHMYQFSLSWYINLYISVIETTGKSSVLERRLKLLQESLVCRVHSAVVCGLSAAHRLPYTFLIALHVLRVSGGVDASEEAWLNHMMASRSSGAVTVPDWLHPSLVPSWPHLHDLMALPSFQGLEVSLKQEGATWGKVVSSNLPEKSLLPRPWNHLSHIPWLILISALRQDKITWAVKMIIEEVLGPQFVSPPPADINRYLEAPVTVKISSHAPVIPRAPVPLLLVTTAGVDALEEVMLLAGQKPQVTLTNVSLGQGQSGVAEAAVSVSACEGGWVVLQNLHHALDWLPTLANIITRLYTNTTKSNSRSDNGTLNPNFRLILTTEPTDEFPVSLLRGVEKLYIDSPGDAYHALQEAIATLIRHASHLQFEVEEDEIEAATYRLLYGLCTFHTVVSERGRHGHLAWASPPTFTNVDLTLALSVVISSAEDGQQVDPETLEYLVGQVFYGGRVKRTEDQQVITSILKDVLIISLKIPDEEEYPLLEDTSGPQDMRHEDTLNNGLGDENDEVGLSILFPDYIGKVDDLQEFVKGVTGLERPEIFGLPVGVQHLQEIETGQHFLTALATVAGAQTLQGSTESSVTKELQTLKKRLPVPISQLEEVKQCEDRDLVDIIKREVQQLNNILQTITLQLDTALQATTGVGGQGYGCEEVVSAVALGHTPLTWVKICTHPASTVLSHFLHDLHARIYFFRNWIEDGCPTYFRFGAFQFLPAFLITVQRKVAHKSCKPLHHLNWNFQFTDLLPENLPDVIPNIAEDLESLDEKYQNEISDGHPFYNTNKNELKSWVEQNEETNEVISTTDQLPHDGDTVQKHSPKFIGLNTEDSIRKWHELGQNGLCVSGLWLVGASWNTASYELEEPASQELMEQLPILNMVPTVSMENGSYTARGPASSCTTARSLSHFLPPVGLMEEDTEVGNLKHNMQSDSTPTTEMTSNIPSTCDGPRILDAQNTAYMLANSLKQMSDYPSLDFGEEMTTSSKSDLPSTRSRYYECPVYEGGPDSSPRPPVLTVTLPAGAKGANYWVQRRVAMYMSKH
nr:dynein axonemal heavy chain 7-like isoform X1 [Procambarus clarkii]